MIDMRKLIINADDLGYSSSVNAEIMKAISLGAITSATLLANGPAFNQGIEIAKKNPQISIGVHLNLVEFRPLTNQRIFKAHGIVNESGYFIEGAIFVTKIDEELKRAIFEEWDAQIFRVICCGIIPSHIDSHEHTHTIFNLRDILFKVLKKYNIRKVRRCSPPSIRIMLKESINPSVKLDKTNSVKVHKPNVIYRRFYLFWLKYKCYRWNLFMRKSFVLTNRFYAFRFFVLYNSLLSLGGKNSTIELMCHPGQKAFESESTILLKDFSWLPKGYSLINYHKI